MALWIGNGSGKNSALDGMSEVVVADYSSPKQSLDDAAVRQLSDAAPQAKRNRLATDGIYAGSSRLGSPRNQYSRGGKCDDFRFLSFALEKPGCERNP